MQTVKETVTGNKKVYFNFYRTGELWYKTECGFDFPVPITDTGDGVFLSEDKAKYYSCGISINISNILTKREMQTNSVWVDINNQVFNI